MHRSQRRAASRTRIESHPTLQFESLESRALLAVIQLAPLHDATLYESATGEAANSVGTHLYAGTIGQNLVRRAVLQFQLNQIPAGSTINSASLSLNMSKTISGSTTIGLQRATQAWAEGPSNGLGFGSSEGAGGPSQSGDPTWIHSAFNTKLWSKAGGVFVTTISASKAVSGTGRYQWTGAGLAADVQQWIDNPTTNRGWFLKEQNEKAGTTAKQFDSRNHPTATSRPKLTIDYTPPISNDPLISNFGGDITYTENAGPIAIAASTATITDSDSANFDHGTLTASFTAGGSTSDRLFIRNSPRVTTNSSSQVLFNGTVIGTFSGGVGNTPLAVKFDADATPTAATVVLRNLVYRNVSNQPTAQRTVSVKLTDGDGGESLARSKKINVTPVNDPPKLLLGGVVGYVHDSPAFKIAPGASVSDVDSLSFNNGRLRVRITDGNHSSNRLTIGTGFSVDGNQNVLYGSTIIGRRTADGIGTNELVVVFTSKSATPAVVQELVRSLKFKTVAGAPGTRKVVFTVTDGAGGVSADAVKTINVT